MSALSLLVIGVIAVMLGLTRQLVWDRYYRRVVAVRADWLAGRRDDRSVNFGKATQVLLCLMFTVLATLWCLPGLARATTWDAAAGFERSPNQHNPSSDGIWSYMQGQWINVGSDRALDTPHYQLLTTFSTANHGYTGLEGWFNTDYPFVAMNTTGSVLSTATADIPPNVLDVHPATAAPVIIRWISPISGTVTVSGSFTDLDPNGGDGVDWYITRSLHGDASGAYTPLDCGTRSNGRYVPNGGAASFGPADEPCTMGTPTGLQTGSTSALGDVAVEPGDAIDVVVDVGPNGDQDFDSTQVVLTIQTTTTTTPTTPSSPTSPAMPTNLTATAINSSAIHLQWTDNTGDEGGFQVQMVGGNTRPGNEPPGAKSGQLDWTGLNSGQQYCFQVRALNMIPSGPPSAWSSRNQACARTSQKLSGKQLTTIGNTLLTLANDWNTYCQLATVNVCKPWTSGARKKALAWLDKAGKVLSVISIGAVGRKEVVVGTDLTSLSAGLTGNISPHPGGLVQGTGSLV